MWRSWPLTGGQKQSVLQQHDRKKSDFTDARMGPGNTFTNDNDGSGRRPASMFARPGMQFRENDHG